MINYLKKLLTFENKVEFELRDEQIKRIVDKTYEKFVDGLPNMKCWQCQKPSQVRITWMDKMFCSEQCHKEHARVIAKPDQDYKVLNGVRIGEFLQPSKDKE